MEPAADLEYPSEDNNADVQYPYVNGADIIISEDDRAEASYPSEEIDVEILYSSDDQDDYNADSLYPSGVDDADTQYRSECHNDIAIAAQNGADGPIPCTQNDFHNQFEHCAYIQDQSLHDGDIQANSESRDYDLDRSGNDPNIQDSLEASDADLNYPHYPSENGAHVIHDPQDHEEHIFNSNTSSSSSSSDDSYVAYQYGDHFNNSPQHTPNVILYSSGDNDASSLRHVTNHRSDFCRQSCPSSNLQFHPVRLKKKSVCMTYILALFLGIFGAHHFYLDRPKFGTLYIFTGGLLGLGYVVDLVRVPWLVDNANLELMHPELRGRKYLMDAYILWLPPFGLLGFHHFYLGNTCQALVYLVTVGAVLMGWVLDACLIPLVWVNKANKDYRYVIESLTEGREGEAPAGWNTDCTVITSPHSGTLPAPVISPPPYTEIDYTETERPPSYNEVLAMDMQESFS